MSNNINTNNSINNYPNINSLNINKNSSSSSNNMLDALGLQASGLDSLLGLQSGEGTENLGQVLQLGMLSKAFGGGESDSGAFQMVLGALVKALNDKQQADNQGVESNSQFDGVHINELVLRTLNSTTATSSIVKSNDERIETAIKEASKKYGVEEGLIRAIIKVESNFNPKAKSSAGAMGLMQLMPGNVKAYGISDPYNIEQNIDAGTNHIKDYLKKYNGNLEMALAAYNFGPGNMNKRNINSQSDFYKLPTETKNYLTKIKKYYNA